MDQDIIASMPDSPVNSPAFWIGFVLAELSLPMIMPNKRWAGVAMFLVALGFLASAYARLRLPSAPPLFPFYVSAPTTARYRVDGPNSCNDLLNYRA